MSERVSCSTIVETEAGILLVGEEIGRDMLFSLLGGKQKWYEEPEDTAVRETFEESGLVVVLHDVVSVERNQRTRAGHKISRVAFCGEIAEVPDNRLTISDQHPIVGFYDFRQIRAMRREGLLKPNGTYKAIDTYMRGVICDSKELAVLRNPVPPSRQTRLKLSA